MRIDERYSVPAESRFELAWKNLLGQRVVQIVPTAGASPDRAEVEEGPELTSARPRSAAALSILLNNTEPPPSHLDVPPLTRAKARQPTRGTGGETGPAQGH